MLFLFLIRFTQGTDDVSFAILFVFIIWDYIPTTLLVITITSKSLGKYYSNRKSCVCVLFILTRNMSSIYFLSIFLFLSFSFCFFNTPVCAYSLSYFYLLLLFFLFFAFLFFLLYPSPQYSRCYFPPLSFIIIILFF